MTSYRNGVTVANRNIISLFSRRSFLIFIIFFLFHSLFARAQTNVCPSNIGFENGDFSAWETSSGTIKAVGVQNVFSVSPGAPVVSRHTLFDKSKNPGVDPFGNFPRVCPSGGQFSAMLGNSNTGAQAERLSYTFSVPVDEPDFTLTYYYAVVFQDPGHSSFQQPRFTAKVVDVATGDYLTCASFEYVATAVLPGFTKSASGGNVYYKSWSPVTLSLAGFGGKQIRIEFSTADCTAGAHFGYAYVDIINQCSGSISGATYCEEPPSITLNGPSGYSKYTWFTEDLTQELSTTQALTLSPAPADNTRFAVKVEPFVGFGCPQTLYATVHVKPTYLQVNSPPESCAQSIDFTDRRITAGSDADLEYTYWKDSLATDPLVNPEKVTVSGTYYIKGTSYGLCPVIKPLVVVVNPIVLKLTVPTLGCNQVIDLTDAAITAGSSKDLTYTYWLDANGFSSLTNPSAVTRGGTYYIRATNKNGCSIIEPITITFGIPARLVVRDQVVCYPLTVDLAAPIIISGSEPGLTYSYWKDEEATDPVTDFKISVTDTLYIKAEKKGFCATIKAVKITIADPIKLNINTPADACLPEVVNLTLPKVTEGSTSGLQLSYWLDANAVSSRVTNPSAITVSRTYYIKGTTDLGCFVIKPVQVTVHPAIKMVVNNRSICSPGTIDLTAAATTNGSDAGLTFTYWTDAACTNVLSRPARIDRSGTFYIKGTAATGCFRIAPVVVDIWDLPNFSVEKPQAIYKPATIDLTSLTRNIAGLKMTYWLDAALKEPVKTPVAVTESGTYYVLGTTSHGCILVYPVTLKIEPVAEIYVPKGFTPLQAINNKLFPFTVNIQRLTSFKVYNKAGNLVYQMSGNSDGWDGYYQSSLQPFDTYTWYLEGIDLLDNYFRRSGNVILIK